VDAHLAAAYADIVEDQLGIDLADHGCAVEIVHSGEAQYLLIPEDGYLVMSEEVRCGCHADQ
jgi:hypothetical protein